MKWLILLACVSACNSKKEQKTDDVKDMVNEASVDFARKELPEIDKKLASDDPGAASSSCAVIKPDMPAIRKADAKLADTIEKKCGHDLALRQLAVFVDKAEAARAKEPDSKFLSECSSWDIYMKPVTAAKADADPEVATLHDRFAKACPGK